MLHFVATSRYKIIFLCSIFIKSIVMVKKEGLVVVPDEVLMNKIYIIRNHKVMLDRDLAELYGVKSIRLREQVKRNITKFPEHFMFQLTEIEVEIMVSQNAIPSKSHLGGTLPFVFTEHGVLMLANVLKSERAVQVSIRIIELFVKLREMLLTNTELKYEIEKIKRKLDNQDKNMEIVFRYLDELLDKKENPKPRAKIGYRLPKK
jgi:phage regulator Rha-like protein